MQNCSLQSGSRQSGLTHSPHSIRTLQIVDRSAARTPDLNSPGLRFRRLGDRQPQHAVFEVGFDMLCVEITGQGEATLVVSDLVLLVEGAVDVVMDRPPLGRCGSAAPSPP